VQARYYAVLVAEETVRIMEAWRGSPRTPYRIQIEQFEEAKLPPTNRCNCECWRCKPARPDPSPQPFTLRRGNQLAFHRQCAQPARPSQLAGNPLVPIPGLRFGLVGGTSCGNSIRIILGLPATAHAGRISLRLQEVTPVPTCTSTSRYKRLHGQLGGHELQHAGRHAIPFFDRNVGGISRRRASSSERSKRRPACANDLTSALADAYERYETAAPSWTIYRVSIPAESRPHVPRYLRPSSTATRPCLAFADVIGRPTDYAAVIGNFTTALGAPMGGGDGPASTSCKSKTCPTWNA